MPKSDFFYEGIIYFQHDFEISNLWLNSKIPSFQNSLSLNLTSNFSDPRNMHLWAGIFRKKRKQFEKKSQIYFDKSYFRKSMKELVDSFQEQIQITEESARSSQQKLSQVSNRSSEYSKKYQQKMDLKQSMNDLSIFTPNESFKRK